MILQRANSQLGVPMDSSQKYLGITMPISLATPTTADEELTESLLEYLRQCGFFESEEDGLKRELVLGKLNLLVKKFVVRVGIMQNMTEAAAAETGGKIFTFGSYRLGVHAAGADIDTLCVVPQHVERNDFFTIFYEMLKESSEVTELNQVPEAFVPLMSFSYNGIPIDLLFAKLPLPYIPDDFSLNDPNILRNLDEKSLLSLNGSRVTNEIIRLVPNEKTFRIALRCIKYWGQVRGLYSNTMGYVGGVTYAMLVARICQLYPAAAASTIVTRFFKIYHQWTWPQPVLLKPIEDLPLGLKVWNPKLYPGDRAHRMPVITPAYPSINSTHNVSASTLSVLKAEFLRGSDIMVKIEQKKATWDDLFAKSDFFHRYKHYFQILVISKNEEAHRAWVGFVESKIRVLTMKLEQVVNIAAAPPFNQGFPLKVSGHCLEDILKSHTFIESDHNSPNAPESSTDHFTTAYYVGISIQSAGPLSGPKKLFLDKPVSEFKQIINSYDKRMEGMDLIIRDMKRDDLPDYVYANGSRARRLKRVRREHTSEVRDQDSPKMIKTE